MLFTSQKLNNTLQIANELCALANSCLKGFSSMLVSTIPFKYDYQQIYKPHAHNIPSPALWEEEDPQD